MNDKHVETPVARTEDTRLIEATDNGDQPIHPRPDDGEGYYGLSKREEFAKANMQALLSIDAYTTETAARMAVEAADALLKELAK